MNVMKRARLELVCVALACLVTGCRTTPAQEANWPVYKLKAEQEISLDLPAKEEFEASGLLLTKEGLVTVSDHGPTLYRIELPATNGGSGKLHAIPNCFTPEQLAKYKPYNNRYDCEGIAQDDEGRYYICEEGNRWILRSDPKAGTSEVLPIDWSSVKQFFSNDRNASFEGIAIGDGKMYVANERSDPVIIQLDFKTLKVEGYFVVWPKTPSLFGILHYSDLSWHKGKLYVMCRHHRVVLRVDPKTHQVEAEYNYREIEDKLGYKTLFPTGVMEGLALDDQYMWLTTDNNGLPRNGNDTRPTLLKCPLTGLVEEK